jgi:hypothetical protein
MKTTLFLCVLAANALSATPILVRVTPETLSALQSRDPMVRLEKPAEGSDTVARPVKQSIISDSTILHDGTNWTLVPKGAVVFKPSALSQRINNRPVGTLLPWPEFQMKNRGWITTTEVSFDQAAGTDALPAERVTFWAKQDKMVIAVHQGGPISVRVSESPQLASEP